MLDRTGRYYISYRTWRVRQERRRPRQMPPRLVRSGIFYTVQETLTQARLEYTD